MTETLLWMFLLGLEVDRFPSVDDGADSLGSSLEVVEAGGHSLGEYDGPAFQPMLAARRGALGLAVLPAMVGRIETLESMDGRVATLYVRQWRLETRVQYGRRVFGELDLVGAGGGATLSGVSVADGAGYFGFGPAVGLRAPLSPSGLWLTGRLAYGWRLRDGLQTDALTGSVAVEWGFSGR